MRFRVALEKRTEKDIWQQWRKSGAALGLYRQRVTDSAVETTTTRTSSPIMLLQKCALSAEGTTISVVGSAA